MDDHKAAPVCSSTSLTARSSICDSEGLEVRFRSGLQDDLRDSVVSRDETTTVLRTLASLTPLALERVLDDSEAQSEEKDCFPGKSLDPPVIDKSQLTQRPKTAYVPRRHESTAGEELHRGNTDDVEYHVVTPPGTPKLRLSEANQIAEMETPGEDSIRPSPEASERFPEDIDSIQPLLESRIGTPSSPKPPVHLLPLIPEEEKVNLSNASAQFPALPPASDHSSSRHSDFSEGESHPAPSDFSFQQPLNLALASPSVVELPRQDDFIGSFPQQPYKRQASIDELPLKSVTEETSRRPTPVHDPSVTKMTYADCLDSLKRLFLPEQRVAVQPKGCLQALLRCCSPPPLSPHIQREISLLLFLSTRPVESQDIDSSLLHSVWTYAFPGDSFSQDNATWKDLGFTSLDPRTEANTLDLLQLLYLFSEQAKLTTDLWRLSRTRGRTFNFAGEITQVTKIVVRAVGTGKLTGRLEKDVWKGFNECFLACVQTWAEERTQGEQNWRVLEARLKQALL